MQAIKYAYIVYAAAFKLYMCDATMMNLKYIIIIFFPTKTSEYNIFYILLLMYGIFSIVCMYVLITKYKKKREESK
jgi:hypothetical protein